MGEALGVSWRAGPAVPRLAATSTHSTGQLASVQNEGLRTAHSQDQFFRVDFTMEADSYEAEASYGTSVATDTTSIKSDILNYRFENGRRYHAYKAGAYLYPNDEQALDQMDVEHHNQGLMLGKLHMSPLREPREIPDVGTGTGIWAIDMADTYPAALITGTDLSPTQPSWVPPNVRFEVDDYTEKWSVAITQTSEG